MPLSETSKRAGSSQHRTDTMIGAGMRVEGHVAFSGVLRVQGEILGDVACQGDAGDTVVVDATGSVTGAVGAPRIVVRGRVLGPLHSAQSIDIQPGGRVVGDASYRHIAIHAGGLVEGALTPALPIDADREAPTGQAPRAHDESPTERRGGRGALAAAALALAVAAGLWLSRPPATPAPPAADMAAKEAAPPPSAPPAAAEPVAAPAPAANAAAPPAAPARPAEAVEETTVQGVNPAKPAGVFLLVSKAPSVLYRKKREEEGQGTRLAVPRGKTVSIAIGRNELFRVAEGQDLEIFYQGRKVAPKTIETGAWMRFVPQGARPPGEERPAESDDGAAR